MSQFDPDPSDQLLETLKNELHSCQTQSSQAHTLLAEICNRLQSTQELINQYQLSTQLKDERIAKLEEQLKLKSNELDTINLEHEELRLRIKSEKHNASQYKAALDRCLDSSQISDNSRTDYLHSQARNLSHANAKFANISPAVPSNHHLVSSTSVDSPPSMQSINSNNHHSFPKPHAVAPEISIPQVSPPIIKDAHEDKSKSTSKIKLPQFAPLKSR